MSLACQKRSLLPATYRINANHQDASSPTGPLLLPRGLLVYVTVLAPPWGQVPLKSNLEPPTPTASPPRTTGATVHPQGLPGPALHPRPSSPSSEHQEPSGPREQQAWPGRRWGTAEV